MKSLRYLYRIGYGPSSSHSIGPHRAAKYVRKHFPDMTSCDVYLFGSLALTGKGHMTDKTIEQTLSPIPCNIIFDFDTKVEHPNTMKFVSHFSNRDDVVTMIVSPGGGAIEINGEPKDAEVDIYPEANFAEIAKICGKNKWTLVDYVRHYEGEEIFDYLRKVFVTMIQTIERGLSTRGEIPGKLHVKRRAYEFLTPKTENESDIAKSHRLVIGYAFATGEENASGNIVVTAPTCGAAGTLPAVLKYAYDNYHNTIDLMVNALAVAGVIGNVIKANGSISGAVAGCQAEIGSACSMAAAAFAYLKGLDTNQIECAAEIAMEHSLGSTCDPVGGYVIIPCIERNAIAADRAITAARLAEYATDTHSVSFDQIIETMLKTGRDMKKAYRETSQGGLAHELDQKKRRHNK